MVNLNAGLTVSDEGSDNLSFWPFSLCEELFGESVPSLVVRSLDLDEGGVGGVEEGVEMDDVLQFAGRVQCSVAEIRG